VTVQKNRQDGGTPSGKPAPCEVTFTYEGQTRKGHTTHFSDTGMMIFCREPAPLNTKLALTIRIPGVEKPVKLSAEVVWTNIFGSEDAITPRGMAVKFLELDAGLARMLFEVSAKYQAYGDQYAAYYS